ncbi:MAG: flagellar protein FlaG [Bacillota bacterium]
MKIQTIGDPGVRSTPGSGGSQVEPVAAIRPTDSGPAQRQDPNPADVAKVVNKMNDLSNVFAKALKFQVSDGSRRIIVKVVDTNTGEVIREIPPEKLVEAFESLEDHLGVLFDRKV